MMDINQRSSRALLGATLGLAVLLGGCALSDLKAPAITAGSVELSDMQLDEQHFIVHLHAQNPNDRPLPIKSANCSLQIEGVEVGKGETAGPFTLPANGDADFDMLVTTNFATSVPNLLRRVVQSGDLPQYHFSGWVHPDITLLPPIPFSKSGQIVLR
jgi:LEA14-like dessication related protein